MPQDSAATVLQRAKTSRRVQVAAIRLLQLQGHVAKSVFTDAEGQISREGERLLALLAQEARLTRHGFNGDADRRLFDMGAQHMVRTLMDWLDIDSARVARALQRLHDERET